MKKICFALAGMATILTHTSCSKFAEKFAPLGKSGYTSVRFADPNRLHLSNTLVGGVMVYARRADGYAESFKLTHENDSSEFTLPNGDYTFNAVGWDAANLTGNTKCGGATGTKTLGGAGGTQLIEMTLSSSGCGTDYFAQGDFRTGNSFNAPAMVFCHGLVDTSAFTTSSDCSNGKESAHFIKGRLSGTGTNGVDRGTIDTVNNRVVYNADIHQDDRFDLYSSDFSGKNVVRQNPALANGAGSVTDVKRPYGKSFVIYRADQDTDNVFELYKTTPGVPGSTKISGTVSAGTGVRDFKISPDGNYLVYVGEMETSTYIELYSVNLNTFAAPVKLSPTITTGTGSLLQGSDWLFQITPDSSTVVFVGNYNTNPHSRLYSSSIAASSAVMLGTTTPPNSTQFEVTQFKLNYNSNRVVWRGDFTTDNIYDIFVSPIGTTNTQYMLHNATGLGTGAHIFLSKTADLAAFSADTPSTGSNKYEFIVSDFSTMATPVSTIVHNTTNTGRFYRDAVFTPDNLKVVYLSDESTAPNYNLYSSTFASANQKVNLTHSTNSSSIEIDTGGSTGYVEVISNTEVYYRGDETGTPGRFGLYKATIGSASSGALVGQGAGANDELKFMRAGFSKIFYGFDTTSDNAYLPYLFSPPSTYAQLSIGSAIYSATDVYVPSEAHEDEPALTWPGYSNAIVFQGNAFAASSLSDLFLVPDYTTASASSLVKLTHSYSGTNSGRFQFSLLRYKTDASGNIVESSSAITSSCLNGSISMDGMAATGLSVFMPGGSTTPAQNPFAVALDIFGDGATGCSGTSRRIVFPNGLANPSMSASTAKIKLATGSGVRFFIKD